MERSKYKERPKYMVKTFTNFYALRDYRGGKSAHESLPITMLPGYYWLLLIREYIPEKEMNKFFSEDFPF